MGNIFYFENANDNCILNIKENFLQIHNNKYHLNSERQEEKGGYCFFKITNNCNIQCTYCFQKKDNKIFKNPDIKLYDKLLDKLLINEKIVIFGGEPFLLKNIDNLEYLFNKMKSNKIKIYTNCCYKNYFNDFLLKNLMKIEKIIVSIDGPEEIHNSRRVYKNNNAYKIILNNISFYLNNHIPFKIQINIDTNNISYIEELLDDLANHFEKQTLQISLNRVLHSAFEINDIQLLNCYIVLKDKYQNCKIDINSIVLKKLTNYLLGKGVSSSRCSAGNNLVYDFLNNQIFVCPQSINNEIGSFNYNIDSIDNKHRENLINIKNKNNTKCNDCVYKNFCKYGCILDNNLKNCQEETRKEIQFILDNFSYFFNISY